MRTPLPRGGGPLIASAGRPDRCLIAFPLAAGSPPAALCRLPSATLTIDLAESRGEVRSAGNSGMNRAIAGSVWHCAGLCRAYRSSLRHGSRLGGITVFVITVTTALIAVRCVSWVAAIEECLRDSPIATWVITTNTTLLALCLSLLATYQRRAATWWFTLGGPVAGMMSAFVSCVVVEVLHSPSPPVILALATGWFWAVLLGEPVGFALGLSFAVAESGGRSLRPDSTSTVEQTLVHTGAWSATMVGGSRAHAWGWTGLDHCRDALRLRADLRCRGTMHCGVATSLASPGAAQARPELAPGGVGTLFSTRVYHGLRTTLGWRPPLTRLYS